MGILGTILKVVTFIPALITGVEHLFGVKQGDQKKAQVIALASILFQGLGAVGGTTVDSGKFNDGLGKVIDGLVEILNASGAFKKS